ncbi:MAG: membrane protein insertion efficiency factor YidD [Bryobacterales bacterium]|nr:membrane protein insertion efficiency factor YidD [Bryobacterales bacterium]
MRRFVILILTGYKRYVSPLLPAACRFHPTCSEYMREAVETWGVGRGVWLGTKRLARCQPFCAGGFDPVPRPNGSGERPGGAGGSPQPSREPEARGSAQS